MFLGALRSPRQRHDIVHVLTATVQLRNSDTTTSASTSVHACSIGTRCCIPQATAPPFLLPRYAIVQRLLTCRHMNVDANERAGPTARCSLCGTAHDAPLLRPSLPCLILLFNCTNVNACPQRRSLDQCRTIVAVSVDYSVLRSILFASHHPPSHLTRPNCGWNIHLPYLRGFFAAVLLAGCSSAR